MTVYDIILSAAELVVSDDVVTVLKGDIDVAKDDDEVKIFITAANTAIANATVDGFPIVRAADVKAVGGIIDVSEFEVVPSGIIGVFKGSSYVSFAYDSRGITVEDDGDYTVVYSTSPLRYELNDVIEIGAGCDLSMLAFLTARNYCVMTGRADDAAVWEQLYETAVCKKRLARRCKLPMRVWR